MDADLLDDIPFGIDEAGLLRQLHVEESSPDADVVRRLAAEAMQVARPKAFCRIVYVDERTEDSVVIDRHRFRSRVLRVNLDDVSRLVAYVATCGIELQRWAAQINDMIVQYWAEAVKQMALGEAIQALNRRISETHLVGQTSAMSPGSLADWPITQQRPLFELLGDPWTSIGVELTESCLMLPNKSVSGVRFPTEVRFENCQLCPREWCPSRRAPYDSTLYATKYAWRPTA